MTGIIFVYCSISSGCEYSQGVFNRVSSASGFSVPVLNFSLLPLLSGALFRLCFVLFGIRFLLSRAVFAWMDLLAWNLRGRLLGKPQNLYSSVNAAPALHPALRSPAGLRRPAQATSRQCDQPIRARDAFHRRPLGRARPSLSRSPMLPTRPLPLGPFPPRKTRKTRKSQDPAIVRLGDSGGCT